jgi:hypothetical protein
MSIKTQSRKRKRKPVGTPKRNKAICMLVYTFYVATGCAVMSEYYQNYDKAQIYIQAQLDYTELCLQKKGCPQIELYKNPENISETTKMLAEIYANEALK